jgi:hypothetical protein
MEMGQLIKLRDYTSRYQQNIYHYPARFVSLKKQQWDKIQRRWENPYEEIGYSHVNLEIEEPFETKTSLFEKIKTLFHRNHDKEIENIDEPVPTLPSSEDEELSDFDSIVTFYHRPETKGELKQQFLNKLFEFQMTWATSTLVDKSFVNRKYYYDENLKYFLQRFPDTYLVLYRPVFKLKKATIEVDTILISPTEVWCITFVEEAELAVFIGSNQKFWTIRSQHKEKKMVNPMIALNRMGKIVKKILEMSDVQLPIHKILLSRNGYIDYPIAPYDVKLVDKKNYDDWFQSLRELRSPLKAVQLKGADALLQYCQTESMRRMEWEVSEISEE